MTDAPGNDVIRGTGTVVFNDFEGGFYGIVADSGKRYYAGTIDEELRQNGLRVRFAIRPLTGVMTVVMWGQPVSIVTLEPLEE